MFTTRFTILPAQVDAFGHLNNAAYLEIYEKARWEWAECGGLDPRKMVEKQRIGPAILHIDLSFLRELRAHEEITVLTWFHSIEKIKARLAQEMIRANGEVASRVILTFVLFNLDTRRMVSMPEEMKRLHEADEEYRRSRGKNDK